MNNAPYQQAASASALRSNVVVSGTAGRTEYLVSNGDELPSVWVKTKAAIAGRAVIDTRVVNAVIGATTGTPDKSFLRRKRGIALVFIENL